jgi:hypothetical protein
LHKKAAGTVPATNAPANEALVVNNGK